LPARRPTRADDLSFGIAKVQSTAPSAPVALSELSCFETVLTSRSGFDDDQFMDDVGSRKSPSQSAERFLKGRCTTGNGVSTVSAGLTPC